MPILLVRHADAVNEGPELDDEQRYLTRNGRAQARALAAELAGAGLALERVFTSPLVRAVQTAELVVAALGLDVEVEATALLAPGGSIRRAASLLADAGGAAMAVGHEPSISALAGTLAGTHGFPSMRKAEAALVEAGALRRWFNSERR